MFKFFTKSFVSFVLSRSESYDGASNFNALLTPLTFLVSYFNSAINPVLYAFLSRNFRKGMRELLLCSFKKTRNEPLKQRPPIHVSYSEIIRQRNRIRYHVLFHCERITQ